jgi:aminopeptidase N
MLSNHLGQEIFLKGVGDYLKIHAYGNARTNDLWAALSRASGQDVRAFMDPWIRKIGFPVVTVAEEPGQISIKQSRFLTTGDVKTEEDETTWWTPVGLKTGNPPKVIQSALTKKSDTVRDIDDKFYKLNSDQSGFYRTNYPAQRLTQLGKQQDMLSIEDKIGLMGDATALATSGESTTSGLLALLEGFKDQRDYLVWSQVSSSLSRTRMVFASNKKIAAGLKNFALKLCSPAAESIGWDFPKDEDYLTGQLRKLLLAMAAGAGHEGIIAEGKKRFEKWESGDEKAIHQNLRAVVFNIAVANGDKKEWNAVMAEFTKTTSVDGKEICIQALGRTKSPELANASLDFAISENVPLQDSHGGVHAIGNNNETRDVAWTFTKTQWTRILTRLSVSNICLDRWIKTGLVHFSDHKTSEDIKTFFSDKDTKAFERSLEVVLNTIAGNANYRERDEALVLEWLNAHGYV